MAVDRHSLIFFIIVFIFLSLPSGNDQPHSHQERQALETFQQSLKQFQTEVSKRHYSSGYGNITGFLLSYDDALNGRDPGKWPLHKFDKDHPWSEDQRYSILPDDVSNEIDKFWGKDSIAGDESVGYLLNISGRSYGEFETSETKHDKVPLELPEYLKKFKETEGFPEEDDQKDEKKLGEMESEGGKMSLAIKSHGYNFQNPDLKKYVRTDDDKVDDAVVVKVKISFQDYPEIESNDIDTNGVYFQDTGSMVTVTNSGKFFGDFGLASLTFNEEKFTKATKLLGQHFNASDVYNSVTMDEMVQFIGRSARQCEFINFIQFEKTQYTVQELRMIDEELKNPTGIPIPGDLPKLRVKESLSYSPDCGVVYRNKPAKFEGEKTEVTIKQERKVFIGFIFLVAAQLYLFMNQIRRSSTPGQLSNISTLTLMMLQYQDSLIALIFLLVSTLFEELYLLLSCVAIFTYIMCGVFEMGFLTQVMKTQINESGTTWWQILRGSTQQTGETAQDPPVPETGLALPVTAPTPTPTAPTPTAPTTPIETDDSNVWNSIFAPGFAITIISTFLIINSTMWRKQYRKVFEIIGLMVVNSYWIPQFLRNTLKNRKVPFTWVFVLGTSCIRLTPILYLNLAANPFRHGRNLPFVIILVSWVTIQLALLYLQGVLGPRFWINEKWLPKAYDYHPIINVKDLEQGYGSDLLANVTIEAGKDVVECKTDCAICMTEVSLPIVQEGKGKFNTKEYMVTPCFHVFHTECLEDWMKYKLQCPVCRNGLPPV